MKHLVAVMLLAVASSLAGAFTVGNEFDVARLGGGSFSDADSSNGAYFYSQTVAENFELLMNPLGYVANSVTWYGMSEAFIDGDIGNMLGFEISFFADKAAMPGTLLGTVSLPTDQCTPTVMYQNSDNPIYSFEASFTNSIDLGHGGAYWVQIGAVLEDGQGDAFIWATGQPNDGYVAAKVGTPWSEWMPLVDSSDVAFVVRGDVVPESPSVLVVLGCCALPAFRRMRGCSRLAKGNGRNFAGMP